MSRPSRPSAGGRRADLYYEPTCPPCRFLSRLAVVLSAGALRRVALGSTEAARLHRSHPEWAGQLLLLDGGRVYLGRAVFAAIPRRILRRCSELLLQPFRRFPRSL